MRAYCFGLQDFLPIKCLKYAQISLNIKQLTDEITIYLTIVQHSAGRPWIRACHLMSHAQQVCLGRDLWVKEDPH